MVLLAEGCFDLLPLTDVGVNAKDAALLGLVFTDLKPAAISKLLNP
jgi:hypothetical protein